MVALLASACGDSRPEVWDRQQSTVGPLVIGEQVIWVERSRGLLFALDADPAAELVIGTASGGRGWAQILDDAPRLESAVEIIRQEHGVLCEEIDQALDMVDPKHETDPEAMREIVLDVTKLLYRHRQRGSDLVYEAYDVDIGGGGA